MKNKSQKNIFFWSSYDAIFDRCPHIENVWQKLLYSKHSVIGHVRYSNGEYVSDTRMIHYLNGDLNVGQKVQ